MRNAGSVVLRGALMVTIIAGALCALPGMVRAEIVGEVVAARGETVLLRAAERLPVEIHMPVMLNDAFETGADGRLKVLFADDSLMTVGRNSSATVAGFLAGRDGAKGNSLVTLVRGTIRSIVGQNGLTVRTPTALAAARGTDFFTRASEDVTEVAVVEDRVWVRNADPQVEGEVEVPEGYVVRVFRGKPPLDPERFTRELLDGLREETDVRITPAVEGRWTAAVGFRGLTKALDDLERTFLRDLIQRELQREPGGDVPVDVIIELPER